MVRGGPPLFDGMSVDVRGGPPFLLQVDAFERWAPILLQKLVFFLRSLLKLFGQVLNLWVLRQNLVDICLKAKFSW